MTIQQYVEKLKEFNKDLPKTIDMILKKNEGTILRMLKLRLYNFGTDGNYDLIGYYSTNTKKRKASKGQKSSFITLRDTGAFYAGMYLESKDGVYKIDSLDPITPVLTMLYGKEILELTFKQQTDIINNIINPELQKILDSIDNIDIVI